ncbi:MAG: hypothetical protein EOP89_02185, partial [Lysobacteraceae bacterium]
MALLASASAWAEPDPAPTKAPTFGRIVIPLSATAKSIVRQRRSFVTVTIKGGDDIATPDIVPRNVVSFAGGHGTAEIRIVPGSLISSRRERDTLIIDVPDPSKRPGGADPTAEPHPNPSKPVSNTPPKMTSVMSAPEPKNNLPAVTEPQKTPDLPPPSEVKDPVRPPSEVQQTTPPVQPAESARQDIP